MDNTPARPAPKRTLIPLTAFALLLALVPAAQAHERDEHGWVTVHDTEDAPPEEAAGGAVECLFWAQGHGLSHPNGTLTALSTGSFGARQEDLGEWTGTPNDDGTYSFEAGPFNITQHGGKWTLIASMRDADGEYHDARSVYFGYAHCTSDSDEVTGDEHGVLTAHDEPQGPASADVRCDFHVRGEGMSAERGRLVAFSHEIGDPHSPADLGEWVGAPQDDGTFSFVAGPFRLGAEGEWNVQAEVGEGNHTERIVIHYHACEEDEGAAPDCPADVTVEATSEGNRLAWSYPRDEGAFRVYRDGEPIAELDGDARGHLDRDVTAGETYAYAVTYVDANGESERCAAVEVTAVPFFGSPLVGALALLGGVGAFAWMRRRA